MPQEKQFQILLVEDNSADVRMVAESLKGVVPAPSLSVVPDGLEALRFLSRRKGDHQTGAQAGSDLARSKDAQDPRLLGPQ